MKFVTDVKIKVTDKSKLMAALERHQLIPPYWKHTHPVGLVSGGVRLLL